MIALMCPANQLNVDGTLQWPQLFRFFLFKFSIYILVHHYTIATRAKCYHYVEHFSPFLEEQNFSETPFLFFFSYVIFGLINTIMHTVKNKTK